jgi:drug/metabolite transporter (DMT)-like permease
VSRRKIPPWLLLRLALAVVLDTAVHVLWKLGAERLPGSLSAAALVDAVHEPLLLIVAVLFAWQLVNWLRVLEGSDLSFSQPITSLSLISVLVVSAIWLDESLGAAKIIGIALVFAGVWFVSRTDHHGGARPRAP